MERRVLFPLIGAGVALFLLANSVFIVEQTQQALVSQFGDIRRVEREPGLKFKTPFIQDVVFYDKRLLDFNAEPEEVITEDKELNITERVVIDAYVRYRITDPVKFYQAVRNEANLSSRMSSILQASMRRTIGSVSLRDLLSVKRASIMQDIRNEVNRKATGMDGQPEAKEQTAAESLDQAMQSKGRGFGIEVVDVRIMRADLPADISQSSFQRMKADFKEAAKFRAEGEERALKIRAGADRERTEIFAEARKKAETIRGEGDGTAAKIYADAFNKDKEFFDFYRSMQAYRKSINKDDTTMVLSPDSDFMRYFNESR